MMKSSDIAKELHISEQTVRFYAREGIIPFVETPGGHRRFALEDVRAALSRAKKHTIEPLGSDDPPRLARVAPATPLRRARATRPGITRTMIAAAQANDTRDDSIPFIGVRGSSRFVVGRGAEA